MTFCAQLGFLGSNGISADDALEIAARSSAGSVAMPLMVVEVLIEVLSPPNPYNPKVMSDRNQPPPSSSHPRILGLDVGSRTIGIAVSDPLGITAQGLETIRRQNKRTDFGRLAELIKNYQVSEIVVGYPLRMNGLEGTQSEKMQLFAEELRKKLKLPVHLVDERLTSAQANRVLRDSEMSIKRRGEVVDRLAAVLILQSWMDMRQNRNQPERTSTND
jgi:putative Holliday junction resolvase